MKRIINDYPFHSLWLSIIIITITFNEDGDNYDEVHHNYRHLNHYHYYHNVDDDVDKRALLCRLWGWWWWHCYARMPVTRGGEKSPVAVSLSLSSLLRNNLSCASALGEEGPALGTKTNNLCWNKTVVSQDNLSGVITVKPTQQELVGKVIILSFGPSRLQTT